jgi:hypothetical protein
MLRWNSYRHDYANEPRREWTAGLIGGVVGMLIMGTLWRVLSNTRSKRQERQAQRLSYYGQAPNRSHIQLSSHPARQEWTR